MKPQNQQNDYCSDDDIFLSPDKRNEFPKKHSHERTVSIRGIYEERVRRLKSCLVGIPRPPVETDDIHFNLEDVQLFLGTSKIRGNEYSMIENCDLEKNKFGMYLNVDHSCEELERLGALFIEKYVPCETISTMSDHFSYRQLTASAKKRRRCNGWASSPGSRLSYLARRKSTFSVDQVSKIGQSASSKQFLLQRDQRSKGVKSVPLKPKRVLFQSPEEDKHHDPFKTPDVDERKRRIRRFSMPNPNPMRLQQQQSPLENRKERSCRKSLEFTCDLDTVVNNRSNESSDKRVKRKLLWAVSTALKSVSVTSSHSKFKLCMNKLFKASLSIWNSKHQDKKSCQENSISTSEAMLIVAKSLLKVVVLPELAELKEKYESDAFCTVEPDQSFHSVERVTSQKNETQFNQKYLAPFDKVCEAEEAIPLRTLTELTNSNNSSISSGKGSDEHSVVLKDIKATPESPASSSTNRISGANNCYQDCSKELFLCSNHKRKREEIDDEEFEGDNSSVNYNLPRSTKKICYYRNGVNKLGTSCI